MRTTGCQWNVKLQVVISLWYAIWWGVDWTWHYLLCFHPCHRELIRPVLPAESNNSNNTFIIASLPSGSTQVLGVFTVCSSSRDGMGNVCHVCQGSFGTFFSLHCYSTALRSLNTFSKKLKCQICFVSSVYNSLLQTVIESTQGHTH